MTGSSLGVRPLPKLRFYPLEETGRLGVPSSLIVEFQRDGSLGFKAGKRLI